MIENYALFTHGETVLLELSVQSHVWNSSSLCLELLFITESANCKCLMPQKLNKMYDTHTKHIVQVTQIS